MADIVLYDRAGNLQTYTDIDFLVVDSTTENVQETYTHGILLDPQDIELSFIDGDQFISVPEGYLIKEAVIKKPPALLAQNIKKGINIAGIVGELIGSGIEKTIELNLKEGNQVIEHDGDSLISKVIIKKPSQLLPENIRENISIAGVTGTISTPKLNQLTSSRTTSEMYDNIILTNPPTNGNFVTSLRCYLDGEVVSSKELSDSKSTITIADMSMYNGVDGEHTLSFDCYANGFECSDKIEYTTNWVGLSIAPDTISDDYEYPAIKYGSTYTGKFSNKSKDEKTYFHENISVKMNGNQKDYIWEDIGFGSFGNISVITRSLDMNLTVPNVVEKLEINIPTETKPKLNRPAYQLICNQLKITPAPYTESIKIYIDNEIFDTINGVSYTYDTSVGMNVSNGNCLFKLLFGSSSTEYYKGRIKFTSFKESVVTVRCVNHMSSNAGSVIYGLLSNLDTELSSSTTVDPSSNVTKNFKSLSRPENVYVTYTVPEGEHFIDVKLLKLTTTDSYSGCFGVIPYTLLGEETISLEMNDYDFHSVTLIASATESLDSEAVTFTYQMRPQFSVENRILKVQNILSNVDKISVYINDNLIDTFSYDGSDNWSVDLTEYPYHAKNENIYIRATGNNIDVSSEILSIDLSFPSPTISLSDKTLVASNIIDQANLIEVYLDNILYKTYDYDSTVGFSQDISDGLANIEVTPSITWNVESLGTTYGFSLNTSTGYYVSNNKGVNNSFALCKVNFNNISAVEVYIKVINSDKNISLTSNVLNIEVASSPDITATFNCINYAESNYDFGILSTLDKELSASYNVDTANVQKSFKGLSKSSVQQVNYIIPSGSHFVYVKYRKDSSQSSNNDTLQFNVSIKETT